MDLTYVLAIFIWASEMLFFPEEIPAKVSINEAIELAKTYWTDTAKKIVNWVLNQVYKNYDELKKKLENFESDNDFSFFKN
jgi:transcription termination factor NusB